MTELNQHLAEIDIKIEHLTECLQRTDDRMMGMELILAWLLKKHPEIEVHKFLAVQANLCDDSRNLSVLAELLDDVRALVDELRANSQDNHD